MGSSGSDSTHWPYWRPWFECGGTFLRSHQGVGVEGLVVGACRMAGDWTWKTWKTLSVFSRSATSYHYSRPRRVPSPYDQEGDEPRIYWRRRHLVGCQTLDRIGVGRTGNQPCCCPMTKPSAVSDGSLNVYGTGAGGKLKGWTSGWRWGRDDTTGALHSI